MLGVIWSTYIKKNSLGNVSYSLEIVCDVVKLVFFSSIENIK